MQQDSHRDTNRASLRCQKPSMWMSSSLMCALFALTAALTGCASSQNRPDWAIRFSFEDEYSCTTYREVRVYKDGRIAYRPDARREAEQAFAISPEQVNELVSMVKAFEPTHAGAGEDFSSEVRGRGKVSAIEFKKRGTSEELARLTSRIAQLTGIQWTRAASAPCPKSRFPLPAGNITLADDLQ